MSIIPSQWRNVAEVAKKIANGKDLPYAKGQALFILQTALKEIERETPVGREAPASNVFELTDKQIVNISREILEPATRETIIRTWAQGLLFGTAHEDPFMNAYLNLTEVGPKNDHDGKRGTALELKRQIDTEIMPHAFSLCKAMRDTVMKMAQEYRSGTETYEITGVSGEKRKVTVANEKELMLHHFSATDDLSHRKI